MSTNTRSARRGLKRKPMACAIQLIFVGSVFLLHYPAPALAQSSEAVPQQAAHNFRVAAGELAPALRQIASQAGVILSFTPEQTQGKNTSGVAGSYTVQQAFANLLKGTGLKAERSASGSYALYPTSDDVQSVLPTVTVMATQDSTTENTGSYTTRITSAATGLPLSLRETPQSVTIVTKQRMEDQNMQSLTDVLSNTTGISASINDGNRMTYFSRGFSITNFQYDGIPTPATANWYAGETELDAAIYDRVEVVRGATGLLTGAGNPSASINLVRKHADSKVFTGEVSLGAGSWNNYRSSVDLSTPLTEDGRIRGRIVATYQDKESFMRLSQVRKTVLYGVIDADLTPATKLSVGMDYQRNDPLGTIWGGLPLWYADGARANWSRSATTAPQWSYWASETQSAFATLEHRFDNNWKANVGYTHSKQALDTKLLFMYGQPDRITGLGMGAVASLYQGAREQDTVTAQLSGPIELLGRKHELTFGFLSSQQKRQYNYQRGLNLAPIVYNGSWNGAYPEPTWDTQQTLEEGKFKQQGVYGAGRFSLSDNLNLILGGRYNHWNDTTPEAERDNKKFTPYAGLTYDISKNTTVYASYTSIFNPQDSRDRNGQYLDPLSGKSYELGIKSSLYGGKLNTSFALFQIQQDNLAVADTGYFVPVTLDQAYYAAKGVKSTGFDMDVSGEILKNWNVSAGLTHYTAKDATQTPVETNQPRTLFRLFSTYRLQDNWENLTLGGGVNWQGTNYTLATGPNGKERVEQSGFALVNLMARYKFSPRLSLQVNLNNALDKKYYSQIGYYNASAWGAPRNVMATMSYKF